MLIIIAFLAFFAGFCAYHYRKPFGLGSPLWITNHYSTSVNGDTYEIILVAWRKWHRFFKKPVRNEENLRKALKDSGYTFAPSDDLCVLFGTPNFALPIGLYISSEIRKGPLVAMILVGGQSSLDNSTFIETGFSQTDIDRYAVVSQGFIQTSPRAKPACIRATSR